MIYKFKCIEHGIHEVDIPIYKYDEEKDKQQCPICNSIMKRVIEWEGIATGNGQGWFGRSDGSKSI